MVDIEYLDWDSTHLGIKVGELHVDPPITKESLDKAQCEAIDNGYDLLYLRGCDLPLTLLSDNIILADQKVVYSKILDESSLKMIPESNVISWLYHELDTQLLSLALQSGGHSRYYLDKRMPIYAFINLYRIWIENSLKGKIASDVLVYRHNSKILGLLTYKQKDDVVEIGLVDVDHSVSGNGIGSKLIQSLFARLKKGTRIEVATQKENTGACHYYEKNGFSIQSVTNIYHIWIKK